jgi:hypothetical protein
MRVHRIQLDGGAVAELDVTVPGCRVVRLLRPWTDGELRIVGEARCIGSVLDDMQVTGDQTVIDLLPTINARVVQLRRFLADLGFSGEDGG